MSESRIITDSYSGLSYQTKSFKFELKGLDYDVAKNEGAFIGFLIIPSQYQHIFNEKIFIDRLGPDKHGHFPLIYNHNSRMSLGRIHLGFVTCYYPERDPIQIWDFQATGLLPLEIPKAEEIYIQLKQEGQKAITMLSLGYNETEKGIFVYEVSIKGGQ